MPKTVGKRRSSALKYTALAGFAAPYFRRVANEKALREDLREVTLSARRLYDRLVEARLPASDEPAISPPPRSLWRRRALMIGAVAAATALLVHPRTGSWARAWAKRPFARVGDARQFVVRPFGRRGEEHESKAA